jgi:hypothetical protein
MKAMSITVPPMTHWFDKWVVNGADRSIQFQRVFEMGGAHLLDADDKDPGRMWLRPRFFPTTGELVQFTIDIRGKDMKRGLQGLILSPVGQDEPKLAEKLPVWDGSQNAEDEYERILRPLVDNMHSSDPTEQRLETLFTIGSRGRLSLDRLRIVYLDDVVDTGDARMRDVALAVFTHLAGDVLTPSQNGGGNGPPEP